MKRSNPDFHKWLAGVGGRANAKKYPPEHFYRLGALSRKVTMKENTKRLLLLWGLTMLGTISKARKVLPSGTRRNEIYWVRMEKGKLYKKYLGYGTEDREPLSSRWRK